jgi:hypothetical protein
VESAIIETDDLSEKSAHIVKFEIQVPYWIIAIMCEQVLLHILCAVLWTQKP